jgi:hypothetical protein
VIRALIVSFLLVATVACGEKPSTSEKRREVEPPAPAAQAQPAASSNEMPVPPHASASEASAAAASQMPPVGNSVSGKVLETMDSGGYTYMKLDTGSGEVWAAVNQTKVKKGQTVTVANAMMMQNFESKTLKRKFDQILFGTLAGAAEGGPSKGASQPAGAAASKEEPALPPGHPNPQDGSMQKMAAAQHAMAGSGADAQEVGKIDVPKAAGPDARTVAEVHAQRTALKDKTVEVRGKVVKFLPQIMGKNWLHVRDGSGSADKKNNDLTVTTKDAASVGDVVLVKGVVHLDRDLGAGYQYPVIVEDAKVTK